MSDRETVVLLHGLARTHYSMAPLARHLARCGYDAVNLHYPSTRHRVEALVEEHLAPALAQLPGDGPVHFATHSMGGILVRQYLAQHALPRLGRVVMIAPPNQGSELVDRLGTYGMFRWVNGPAGGQLGTDGLPGRLGPVRFPLGVIAGSATVNPLASWLLGAPGDGKVTIERARVEGMADFIVLPYSHPFIMRRRGTLAQVAHFLRHGRFDR